MLMEKHNWNETILHAINTYLAKNNKHELIILTPTSHKSFYHSVETYLHNSSN